MPIWLCSQPKKMHLDSRWTPENHLDSGGVHLEYVGQGKVLLGLLKQDHLPFLINLSQMRTRLYKLRGNLSLQFRINLQRIVHHIPRIPLVHCVLDVSQTLHSQILGEPSRIIIERARTENNTYFTAYRTLNMLMPMKRLCQNP